MGKLSSTLMEKYLMTVNDKRRLRIAILVAALVVINAYVVISGFLYPGIWSLRSVEGPLFATFAQQLLYLEFLLPVAAVGYFFYKKYTGDSKTESDS